MILKFCVEVLILFLVEILVLFVVFNLLEAAVIVIRIEITLFRVIVRVGLYEKTASIVTKGIDRIKTHIKAFPSLFY